MLDVLGFQSVFQCWLHDCNMDTEHLSLLLPAAAGEPHPPVMSSLLDGDEVIVRCDLYERIMDPMLLPTNLTNHFVSVCSVV